MKKPKTVVPFYYKEKTHQQVVNLLNKEDPINLSYNEDLINRVYARYPIINKAQVALIVKGVFQSFRDLLVAGEILNFHNLFFNTKLHFYIKKNALNLKVKISTPPKLRKNNEQV
jgi:hypothetical protein